MRGALLRQVLNRKVELIVGVGAIILAAFFFAIDIPALGYVFLIVSVVAFVLIGARVTSAVAEEAEPQESGEATEGQEPGTEREQDST
jgi:hypothetical protein